MRIRNLFLIHSLIALLYSLGLLLIPQTMLFLYGVTSTAGDRLLAQFFGVQLLMSGMATLLARDESSSGARNAITLSILISSAVGLIVSIGGTMSGTMNALGWSAVVIYGFFAIAFAYFQFIAAEE